jgi:hypothetical protein
LHIAPIAEIAVMAEPAVPAAPAMEVIRLVVEPAGFTPASAAAVMMPMHETMEQEVPVHDGLRYIEMTVKTIYRKYVGVQAAAGMGRDYPLRESMSARDGQIMIL